MVFVIIFFCHVSKQCECIALNEVCNIGSDGIVLCFTCSDFRLQATARSAPDREREINSLVVFC